MIRVFLGGLIGGVLVFVGGALGHSFLQLEGRALQRVPNEAEVREYFSKRKLDAGIYNFPHMPDTHESTSSEDVEREFARVNRLYREGPAAMIIVAPTGEDIMSIMQLGPELVTNILAAVIAAFVLVSTAPGTSYLKRYWIVLLLGLFTWLCTSASFAIWFRFPWTFILDGLFASMIEWGIAGIVLAAITRPAQAAEAAPKPV